MRKMIVNGVEVDGPVAPHFVRGSYVPPMKKPIAQTPNWDKWKHMKNVLLWEAVALALNINPEFLNDQKHHERPFGKNLPQNYLDLREIATSRKLDFTFSANNFGDGTVDLSSFGDFVESLGAPYSLPREYPRSTNTPKKSIGTIQADLPAPSEERPPYMTPKLRALFKVMQEEEVKRRPEEKAASVIMDAMGLVERDARLIASLINDKPTGTARKWKNE